MFVARIIISLAGGPSVLSRHAFYFNRQLAFQRAPAVGQQVFVVSKDGAQVPMFVVAPLNTSLDGTYPTVLYGYGGTPRSPPSYSAT